MVRPVFKMPSDTNKKSVKSTTATLTIIITITIAIIGAAAYGFLRSLFNTFTDFIHANHEYAADAALLFFIVIYIVTKAKIRKKHKKDE